MARLGRSQPRNVVVARNAQAAAGAAAVSAQPATLTLTAVAGTATTGAVTVAAQPATLTLTALAVALATSTVLLSDDFPGTSISDANWDVYDRLGDQVNNEVNAVIPANVRVGSGTLKIDSKFEDVVAGDTTTGAPNPRTVHYTSGQIAHRNIAFRYGSVQVRAKICPNGTGTWPCIWMLGHDWQASQPHTANTPEHDWPNGGWWEIDIAEFMQGHRTLQNCALHFVTANRGGSGEKTIPFDASTRFMVYRLDWTATSLTWYIDAEDGNGWVQLLQISGTAGTDIPDTPGYLIVHTAIGGNAAETPVSGTFPVTTEVDYARITLDSTSSVTVLAQPATLTLSGVAGTPSSATTRTAQVAFLAVTAVPGTVTPGPVTVVAQPASINLGGVAGTTTVGSVSNVAQPATVALTAVAGTTSVGATSESAQPASITLTAAPGAVTPGAVTLIAQPGTLTLSAVAGTTSVGAVTELAQPATTMLTAVPGVLTSAGQTVAQLATLTLAALPGTPTAGTATTTAQPATLTFSPHAGMSTTGPVSTSAQPATLTLTAMPGVMPGHGAGVHVGSLDLIAAAIGSQPVTALYLGAEQVWP